MPPDDTSLISSIRSGRPTWTLVGWAITFTLSVAGSWYASRFDTQAQFAQVQSQIEQQALSDSQTYATKADLAEIMTTLQKLMVTTSEIKSDMSYVKGRVDQLTK